jgi:DMSO reductase family type II enzyme heme b subunit
VWAASAIIVAGSLAAPQMRAQEQPGKAVYERWCAECHGESGAGDGSAAGFMLPRPRDFSGALYQIRTTASGELPTDADIRRVIDEGMPGTAMPGWKTLLSGSERDALVDYLKSFSRFFQGAPPEPLGFGNAPRRSEEGLAEGRRAFEELECFKCHGDAGRGDGSSAPTLTDDWDFPIQAADLTKPWTFNGGARVEDIYRRLRTGLDGTPMPSFADAVDAGIVTDEQLWRLAQYVRGLAPDDTPPVREVVRAVRVDGALPLEPADEAWEGVERFYIPLVGQIVLAPRWFAPRVEGLWVQAAHDGATLALKVAWSDPSRSPDPDWQEWLDRMAQTMEPVDGPAVTEQGADRLHVQFPLSLSDGMDRPYFLGGDERRPAYLWRWTSTPDRLEEGVGRGWGQFTPRTEAGGARHATRYVDGQWELVITRPLVPGDAGEATAFEAGRAIPMAFFAADGSNGEGEQRGGVSTWYAIYLEVPTPVTALVVPALAMLLTAGLGLVVVHRAQQRDRMVARTNVEDSL